MEWWMAIRHELRNKVSIGPSSKERIRIEIRRKGFS